MMGLVRARRGALFVPPQNGINGYINNYTANNLSERVLVVQPLEDDVIKYIIPKNIYGKNYGKSSNLSYTLKHIRNGKVIDTRSSSVATTFDTTDVIVDNTNSVYELFNVIKNDLIEVKLDVYNPTNLDIRNEIIYDSSFSSGGTQIPAEVIETRSDFNHIMVESNGEFNAFIADDGITFTGIFKDNDKIKNAYLYTLNTPNTNEDVRRTSFFKTFDQSSLKELYFVNSPVAYFRQSFFGVCRMCSNLTKVVMYKTGKGVKFSCNGDFVSKAFGWSFDGCENLKGYFDISSYPNGVDTVLTYWNMFKGANSIDGVVLPNTNFGGSNSINTGLYDDCLYVTYGKVQKNILYSGFLSDRMVNDQQIVKSLFTQVDSLDAYF